MASGDQVRFSIDGTVSIPSEQLVPIDLSSTEPSPHVHKGKEGIEFGTHGWYEVLLRVDWDPAATSGTRFSHTKIPDQEPLHSEAIDAAVLARISEGRQLLRGNSLFGPNRTTCLTLEVWQDSGSAVDVTCAELVVRELDVPWHLDGGQE